MTGAEGVRAVDVARLTWGTVALLRPRWLIRAAGSADGVWPRRVTQILGARYVAQSAAGFAVSQRWVREVGGVVDLLHAASTVAFARAFPGHRRLALGSGAVAVVFAVADLSKGRVS